MVRNKPKPEDVESLEGINSLESTTTTISKSSDYLVGVYDEDDIGKFFGQLRRADGVEKERANRQGDILFCWVEVEESGE